MALNVNIPSTNGLHVEFTAGWKCLKFYGCNWWKPATGVYWARLPENAFAAFHESTTCYAGGKPKTRVYYTKQGDIWGSHAFETPMAIRSMMIGFNKNYTRRPRIIYYDPHCRLIDTDFENSTYNGATNNEDVEMAANSSGLWSDDDTTNGGLSSNWTTRLPE
ncbi:hypothetical protein F442_21974, partial [Phytophthora nicotianae P10297]